ncbi:hypothetical protein DICVIV_14504 [Dictyocaulus viviparus]|uniref:Uncharacterized protein n=1 Tax=Dictyocaulus viviparus TaxID=29172 RepID=A0A0D8X545_DICVI|nr:hypothetical protein DICVIV_14504 [Dictyocaulus viviparus]
MFSSSNVQVLPRLIEVTCACRGRPSHLCLAETSVDGESNRVVRFANFLLKVLNMRNMDEAGMELAACALAFLIQVKDFSKKISITILNALLLIKTAVTSYTCSDFEIICCRISRKMSRPVFGMD